MTRKIIIIICLIALSTTQLIAQNLDELRNEQKEVRAQIERITTELKQTKGSQKDAQNRLRLLNDKIQSRKTMVSNIDKQIAILDNQLGNVHSKAQLKKNELNITYKEYVSCVNNLYASMRKGTLRGQGAMRQAYMGRIVADSLSVRALEISKLNTGFRVQADNITHERDQLDKLVAEHQIELETLACEIEEARQIAATLNKSAQELTKQERANKAKIEELERKITEAINSEVNKSSGQIIGTEDLNLSKDFTKNKGMLPWPATLSLEILENYGINQVQKGIKLNNKGLTLRLSSEGSTVRSIFEGEVRRVFSIMGLGQCVIVRHGEYLSVYSSLAEVSVCTGQKVKLGQEVGKVGDDGNLHFELWRENSPLNPSEWLTKKK